jgi:CheY-like chemotaxis protein
VLPADLGVFHAFLCSLARSKPVLALGQRPERRQHAIIFSHQFSTARSAIWVLNFDQVEAVQLLQVLTLVVDDFASFRRRVCWMLEEKPEVRVVCEAADGAEAVQKAVELQPDLILLDSDLPKLSGIEAARQIRQVAPKAKIIFLSQDSNPEIVQDAFSLGARGYVIKSDAARELLTAVNAVILGKQYVSRGLASFDLTDAADE